MFCLGLLLFGRHWGLGLLFGGLFFDFLDWSLLLRSQVLLGGSRPRHFFLREDTQVLDILSTEDHALDGFEGGRNELVGASVLGSVGDDILECDSLLNGVDLVEFALVPDAVAGDDPDSVILR